jgi:hypothetical protein
MTSNQDVSLVQQWNNFRSEMLEDLENGILIAYLIGVILIIWICVFFVLVCVFGINHIRTKYRYDRYRRMNFT